MLRPVSRNHTATSLGLVLGVFPPVSSVQYRGAGTTASAGTTGMHYWRWYAVSSILRSAYQSIELILLYIQCAGVLVSL